MCSSRGDETQLSLVMVRAISAWDWRLLTSSATKNRRSVLPDRREPNPIQKYARFIRRDPADSGRPFCLQHDAEDDGKYRMKFFGILYFACRLLSRGYTNCGTCDLWNGRMRFCPDCLSSWPKVSRFGGARRRACCYRFIRMILSCNCPRHFSK